MSGLTESDKKANWLTCTLSTDPAKSIALSTDGGVLLVRLVHLLSKPAFLSRRLAALACLIILAGCATQEPEVRTVRVEVPVLVPCKTQDIAVPPWAAAGLQKADSLEVKVRALLAERRQRMGYERELVAAVSVCR